VEVCLDRAAAKPFDATHTTGHNLCQLEMCGNDFRVPIPSHTHDFVPIPIPSLGKS